MPKKKVGTGRGEGTRDGCRARAIASWPANGDGFRVFRKARGSRETVKMQGYLCTGALALRGHENSGAHHRPARPSTVSPRHPEFP